MISPQFVVPDVVAAAEYYRDVLRFRTLGYFLDPPVRRSLREIPSKFILERRTPALLPRPTSGGARQAWTLTFG
jgi:hypothetical protein